MWGAGQEPVRLPSLSATALPEEDEWRHQAACAGEETDLFFPVGTSPAAIAQAHEAKKVCAGCPVRLDCLKWAIDTAQEWGVWGGLTEDERRVMKRRSNKLGDLK
jgi:WhiB family redox-sensing transcriptional regulator